jgi:hypothetical protein
VQRETVNASRAGASAGRTEPVVAGDNAVPEQVEATSGAVEAGTVERDRSGRGSCATNQQVRSHR